MVVKTELWRFSLVLFLSLHVIVMFPDAGKLPVDLPLVVKNV